MHKQIEVSIEDCVPCRVGELNLGSIGTRQRFFDSIKEQAKLWGTAFRRNGFLPMHFLVFCERDPKTGKGPPCVYLVPVPGTNYTNAQKNQVAELVRLTVTFGCAVAFAMVSEAWVVTDQKLEPDDDISGHPDRRETLLVLSDHREFGPSRLYAPITTEGETRTLGEWTPIVHDQMEGRFSELLTPLSSEELEVFRREMEAAPP